MGTTISLGKTHLERLTGPDAEDQTWRGCRRGCPRNQTPVGCYTEIIGESTGSLSLVSNGATARKVIANMVLGASGATTLNGSSRGLSSGSDRERFHELRSLCDAIMIGGATATHEPYSSTPKPLIVISHMKVLPGTAAKNPDALLSNLSIAASINKFGVLYPTILIEGGPNFLAEAIAQNLINDLYLTRSSTAGHPPFFDTSLIDSHFRLVERIESVQSKAGKDELLEHYQPF